MKFNKQKEGKIDFWILKSEWAPLAKFAPKKKKTKTKTGDPFTGAPGALKFHKWSTTLEINNDDSANGQKGRTICCDIHKRSRETLPSGVPFVPNEDENAKYKKKVIFALTYLKIQYS